MNPESQYFKRAELMLQLIPFVAEEKCFALKGGTAINFFLRDMPRLSVDIDLVYLPIEPREVTLKQIGEALKRISVAAKRVLPKIRTQEVYLKNINTITKIFIKTFDMSITIEPNLVIRGSVFPCEERKLTHKAEAAFKMTSSITTLSLPDLYGGKLCAALDRQHPRDLFDVKMLFENEGITDKIRQAFVLYLVSHDRPMHEVLNPKQKDINEVFGSEFLGMTNTPVTYASLIETREELINVLQSQLTDKERRFLLSVKQGTPHWDLMDVKGIEKLPAIQWKIMNVRKLSPQKHAEYTTKLKKVLGL